MNTRTDLIAFFLLGVLLEAIYLTQRSRKWGRFALCLAVPAFIGLYTFAGTTAHHSTANDIPPALMFGIVVFAFAIAIMFRREILPVVTENLLLSYTLLFWCGFIPYVVHDVDVRWLWVSMIPTLATLYIAFVKVELDFFWKLLLYSWFLCLIATFGAHQFADATLDLFNTKTDLPSLDRLSCLLAGMSFLYLLVYASYIFELIPIPSKTQSFEDRMKEWHELTDLMTQRCDLSPTRFQAVLLIVGEGGVLFVNYLFKLVPHGILLNVVLVAPMFLFPNNNATPSKPRIDRVTTELSDP